MYNSLVVNVEIVTIGNEVLLGLVEDTNSHYLCRVVREMGGRVRHIAIVRDEVDSIAQEVRASLARRADLIFTCGGLGPTDDDSTTPLSRWSSRRRGGPAHPDRGHDAQQERPQSLLEMNAERLDFPDDSFDVVRVNHREAGSPLAEIIQLVTVGASTTTRPG